MSANNQLKDFKPVDKLADSVIAKYESLVPEGVISLWKDYGTGTFKDGYLKLVNPEEYENTLKESYENIDSQPIAVFATAMADIIAYESGYFILINYRKHTSKTIGKNIKFLLEDFDAESFLNKNLDWQPYPEALIKLGRPAYDECFAYEPILAAGGSEKVDKLSIVKLIEHIDIITQFAGPL